MHVCWSRFEGAMTAINFGSYFNPLGSWLPFQSWFNCWANVRLYEFSEFMLSFWNESWGIAPLLWERKSSLNWIIVFTDQILPEFICGWDDYREQESNDGTWFYDSKGSHSGGTIRKWVVFRLELRVKLVILRMPVGMLYRIAWQQNSWNHFLCKISLRLLFRPLTASHASWRKEIHIRDLW